MKKGLRCGKFEELITTASRIPQAFQAQMFPDVYSLYNFKTIFACIDFTTLNGVLMSISSISLPALRPSPTADAYTNLQVFPSCRSELRSQVQQLKNVCHIVGYFHKKNMMFLQNLKFGL